MVSVEHGIPEHEANDAPPHSHRRPDLSTFFSTFELIDTSNTTNSNAIPTPGDLSAAFRSLAEAYDMMRQEGGSELLDILAERLYENAEAPPREVQGVNDEFLAGQWHAHRSCGLENKNQATETFSAEYKADKKTPPRTRTCPKEIYQTYGQLSNLQQPFSRR